MQGMSDQVSRTNDNIPTTTALAYERRMEMNRQAIITSLKTPGLTGQRKELPNDLLPSENKYSKR